MKAISLWQPWASAVAIGSKTIETRSWATNYRGPLAIHAAKRMVLTELIHLHSTWNWQGALAGLGVTFGNFNLDKILPFGAFVAIVDLTNCRPTEVFTIEELDTPRWPEGKYGGKAYSWTERQLGDFSPGRFGWTLLNPQYLSQPIQYPGRQGLFEVSDSVFGGKL